METVEVTARFDANGSITPIQLTWRRKVYPVISTGRNWHDGDGIHILAMIPGDRVVELVFAPMGGRWYLRVPGQPSGPGYSVSI